MHYYTVSYLIDEYQVKFKEFDTLKEVMDFSLEASKDNPYAILEIKCRDRIDRRKPDRN